MLKLSCLLCSLTLFSSKPPARQQLTDVGAKTSAGPSRTGKGSAAAFMTTCAPRSNSSISSQAASKRSGKSSSTQANAATSQLAVATPSVTYDWGNTCCYSISRSARLLVEPEPGWPVNCSAAYHAAHVSDSVLRTPDFWPAVRASAPELMGSIATW